jgi:P-type E1-E2 ATPase
VLHINVPGFADLRLQHLVLDLNGTLALDGRVLPGVLQRLSQLSQHLAVHLISADTRGTAASTAQHLGVSLARVERGSEPQQKGQFVRSLGPEGVVAIGNGANDAQMLEAAILGIAVLGPEGLALAALQAADVVVPSVVDALDLLLEAPRLIATLRS